MTCRRFFRAVATALALAAGAGTVSGYVFWGGSRWPDGAIAMHLQLGPSPTLSDGRTSWNQVFAAALTTWNASLSRVGFQTVNDSTAQKEEGNHINNVFFSNTVYGDPFDSRTLAITTLLTVGSRKTEGDVIFNAAQQWDSYRGNYRISNDLYRVGLHESGHILGLDHPDDYGQHVVAQMNSIVSNLDTLAADDIAGARALYPAATPAPPPASIAPGPPSGLTAFASGSSVTLLWRSPSSGGTPTSYIIEAGSQSGAANLANFATNNTSTSFSTTGVGTGTYFVRIRAANAVGTSAPSNEAILIVTGSCSAAPGAPTGLVLVSKVGGTVVIAWNPAAGSTTYIVEAGSLPNSTNIVNTDLGSGATSLTAPNVGPGTYYVRIRGKNACGTGPVSNEIVIVMP